MTDISFKDPVKVATVANITLSAPQTIDGVAVVAGDRVLVKNQSSSVNNGIWIVAAGAWARATDFDAVTEVVGGTEVFVTQGTTQGSSTWFVTGGAVTITPGTDPITFANDTSTRGFSQLTTYAAGTLGAKLKNEVYVTDAPWNAVADPSIDAAPAIQAALNYVATLGGGIVRIPDGTFRCDSGIQVPGECELAGEGMIPSMAPWGTILKFANGVSACVSLTNGLNRSAVLRDLTVWRGGTTPPAGSIGVKCDQGANIVIDRVFSLNHGKCFWFQARGPYGITAYMDGCYTGQASEDHIWCDTWAELRVSNSRFGIGGAYDYDCTSYVRFLGLDPAPSFAAGPNTVVFVNCQFNQGNGGPLYFFFFDRCGTPFGNTVEFSVIGCHCETLRNTGALIKSNASTPYIFNMYIGGGSTFNNPNVPIFDLDANTSLGQFNADGAFFYTATTTLNTKQDLGVIQFNGGLVTGAMTINGHPTNISNVQISGTNFGAGLTLTGKFGCLMVDTPSNVSSTAVPLFSNSLFSIRGNGTANVMAMNRMQSWAPGIGTSYTPPSNGYMGFETTSNTAVKLKLKGSDGVTREITHNLGGPNISFKKYTGTLNGSGLATFAHGLASPETKVMNVRGQCRNGLAAYPIAWNYVDGANIQVSGLAGYTYTAYIELDG